MGGDGGTLSHARRDQLRMFTPKAGRAAHADPAAAPATAASVALSTCALSREALEPPIVVCSKGYLYNKAAVLTHLLSLKHPAAAGLIPAAAAAAGTTPAPDGAFAHLRRRSDVMDVRPLMLPSTRRQAGAPAAAGREGVVPPAFACPITRREATGRERWLAVVPCGCVVSGVGWDGVRAAAGEGADGGERCPVCEGPVDGRVVLGGGKGAGGQLGKRPAKGSGGGVGAASKKRERCGGGAGGDAGERAGGGGGGEPEVATGKGVVEAGRRSAASALEPVKGGTGTEEDTRAAGGKAGKRQRRD